MLARFKLCAATAAAALLFAAPATAGNGTKALKVVPDDALAVVHIDMARIQKSPLFKQAWKMVTAKNDPKKELAKIKKTFGVDVMKDVRGITVYVPTDVQKAQNAAVVFEGKFKKDKILAGAKAEKAQLSPANHAGAEYYADAKNGGAMAFLDGHMVVGKADAVKRVLAVTGGKGKPVTGSKQLGSALKTTMKSNDIWFAVQFNDEMKKEIPADAGKPLGLTAAELKTISGLAGSFDLKKGIGMALRLDTGDATIAKKISDTIGKQIAAAGQAPQLAALGITDLSKAASVSTLGRTVNMKLNLDQQTVTKIQAMVGMMMGMAGQK